MIGVFIDEELEANPNVVSLSSGNETTLSFKAHYSGETDCEFYVDYRIDPTKYVARFYEELKYTCMIPIPPEKVNLKKKSTEITRKVKIKSSDESITEELFKITAMISTKDSSGNLKSVNLTPGHCKYIK